MKIEVIESSPPDAQRGSEREAKYFTVARMTPNKWIKVGPFTYWPSRTQSRAKRKGFECVNRKEGEEEIYMYVRWPNGEDE